MIGFAPGLEVMIKRTFESVAKTHPYVDTISVVCGVFCLQLQLKNVVPAPSTSSARQPHFADPSFLDILKSNALRMEQLTKRLRNQGVFMTVEESATPAAAPTSAEPAPVAAQPDDFFLRTNSPDLNPITC